jgi:hypothetical protein
MPVYRVYTTETVSYCYKVSADNEEHARKRLMDDGDYDDCDWCDGWGFEIAEIMEDKE